MVFAFHAIPMNNLMLHYVLEHLAIQMNSVIQERAYIQFVSFVIKQLAFIVLGLNVKTTFNA
jgi:hypothetical protein